MNQNKESVRRYFTREASRFDAIYDGGNRSLLHLLVDRLFRTRMLIRRNQLISSLVEEGADCLEIGCGSGRTAVALAETRGARVHGIDFAEPMIDLARRRAESAGLGSRCVFEAVDLDEFRPARRFDTVVVAGVLDYFSDSRPIFRRAAREFLRPGGTIVVSWPVKLRILNSARRHWLLRAEACPVFFYDDADIGRLASEAGGSVVRAFKTGLVPFIEDGIARIVIP